MYKLRVSIERVLEEAIKIPTLVSIIEGNGSRITLSIRDAEGHRAQVRWLGPRSCEIAGFGSIEEALPIVQKIIQVTSWRAYDLTNDQIIH